MKRTVTFPAWVVPALCICLCISIGLLFRDRIRKMVTGSKPITITHAFNRQKIYAVLPVTETDIVFVGDSHTQFFDTQEFLSGYPIKNRGIAGDISLGVLERIHQVIDGHPKKLFLEIGFNDLASNVPADTVCNTINAIIDTVHKISPKTLVYLNNVFPCNYVKGEVHPMLAIISLNGKLVSLARRQHVVLIDVYSKLVDLSGGLNPEYDSGDQVHLNGKGYRQWSAVLKPYL